MAYMEEEAKIFPDCFDYDNQVTAITNAMLDYIRPILIYHDADVGVEYFDMRLREARWVVKEAMFISICHGETKEDCILSLMGIPTRMPNVSFVSTIKQYLRANRVETTLLVMQALDSHEWLSQNGSLLTAKWVWTIMAPPRTRDAAERLYYAMSWNRRSSKERVEMLTAINEFAW